MTVAISAFKNGFSAISYMHSMRNLTQDKWIQGPTQRLVLPRLGVFWLLVTFLA